jgi:hypothetical protein
MHRTEGDDDSRDACSHEKRVPTFDHVWSQQHTYGVLNDTSHRSRSMGKKARNETSGGDVHVWCCQTAKVQRVVGMKCQQKNGIIRPASMIFIL